MFPTRGGLPVGRLGIIKKPVASRKKKQNQRKKRLLNMSGTNLPQIEHPITSLQRRKSASYNPKHVTKGHKNHSLTPSFFLVKSCKYSLDRLTHHFEIVTNELKRGKIR